MAEKAVATDPMAIPAVIYLTDLLLKMKEAPAALAVVEGIEARLPTVDDVGLLATFSRAYIANGQRSAAQMILQRGSSLAGYDARNLLIIADLQRDAGDLKGAVWSLQKAMEGEPSFLPARIKLGELAASLGDMTKANSGGPGACSRISQPSHTDTTCWAPCGRRRAMIRGALEHFRAALALEDSPVLAVRVYGAERRVNGDAAAIAFLRDWLDATQAISSPGWPWRRATARCVTGRALRNSTSRPSPSPRTTRCCSTTWPWSTCSSRIPGPWSLRNAPTRALPGSADIGDTLGWVMVRTGDITEGLKYLRDAQSRVGSSPGLLYHIAYALNELGRQREALAELEQATASDQAFAEREEALALMAHLGQVSGVKTGAKAQ